MCYLIDFGYSCIGLIVGFVYVLNVWGRVDGYVVVMVEVGLLVDFGWVVLLGFGIEMGVEVVIMLMVLL